MSSLLELTGIVKSFAGVQAGLAIVIGSNLVLCLWLWYRAPPGSGDAMVMPVVALLWSVTPMVRPLTAVDEVRGVTDHDGLADQGVPAEHVLQRPASLRVDLGKQFLISRITPHWTDVPPSTRQIVTSTDATHWTAAPAKPASTIRRNGLSGWASS